MGNENSVGDSAQSGSSSSPSTSSARYPLERREQICSEILATEERYIRGLTTLDRYYRVALLEAGEHPDTVELIFSSLPRILQVHNQQMLPQLQLRCTRHSPSKHRWCVAQVFIDFACNLELYSVFVNNFERANAEVARAQQRKRVELFFTNAKTLGESEGLDFDSLFITVVQRVPRYLLLLQDLHKHVPSGELEHRLLAKALALLAAAADSINQKKAEFQDYRRLGELAKSIANLPIRLKVSGRRILETDEVLARHGPSGSFRPATYWLFNDSILFARPALMRIGRAWTTSHFSFLKDTELFEQDCQRGIVRLDDSSQPGSSPLFIQLTSPTAAWIQKICLARSRVSRRLPSFAPRALPTMAVDQAQTPGCFSC